MYRGSVKAGKDVGCVDCHMAKIANRSDPTAKVRDHWDASAHTMAVFAPAEADRLKLRSSCDACHTGAQRAEAGESFAKQWAQVKAGQADAERLIAEREKAGRPVDKARAALAPVVSDRGAGAHNPARALAAIGEAMKALAP
jgi:formate-dependent nitrite reductase cytochrome c552 subunit